jgi:hypothetical protein
MERCHELCSHEFHPFYYVLDDEERECISSTGYNIHDLFYNAIPKHTAKIDQSFNLTKMAINSNLNKLYLELEKFFIIHPDEYYFIRMNTISPKDASTFINVTSSSLEDKNDLYTDDMIKNDINYLKISVLLFGSPQATAEYCIQLLCYSERVNLDIKFVNDKLCLLLLPWIDINNSTETRCFRKSGKLLAISQYYEDLTNCYDDVDVIYTSILSFFETNKHKLPETNISMDLHIKNNNVNIIEYNYFDESDKCLFSKDELNNLEIKSQNHQNFQPPFRYKVDNIVQSI